MSILLVTRKGRKMRKAIVFLIALIIGAPSFSGESSDDAEVKYYRMYPDFVTNLASENDTKHYLQVRIETMTVGEKNLKLIELHEPLLRDKLILLFNNIPLSSFKSAKEKKKIQRQALELMQKTLTAETGSPVIEKILFTQVVIE